jgi:hypothetical protein
MSKEKLIHCFVFQSEPGSSSHLAKHRLEQHSNQKLDIKSALFNQIFVDEFELDYKIKLYDDIKMFKTLSEEKTPYNIIVSFSFFETVVGSDESFSNIPKDCEFNNKIEEVDFTKSALYLMSAGNKLPKFIKNDIQSGLCKLSLINLIEQFSSVSYFHYIKTFQQQLRFMGVTKFENVTIYDMGIENKELQKHTDITFKNFNYIFAYFYQFVDESFIKFRFENNLHKKNKKALLFTHNIKQHRLGLLYLLWKNNLLDDIHWSIWLGTLFKNYKGLDDLKFYGIKNPINDLFKEEVFSGEYDDDFTDFILKSSRYLDINEKDLKGFGIGSPDHIFNTTTEFLHSDSYFQIVSETTHQPHDEKEHKYLSEKIFFPLLLGLPFIFVGREGMLKEIKSQGFKVYDDYIDTSYDNEKDDWKRLKKVYDLIADILKKDMDELQELYESMMDDISYNRKFMKKYVVKHLKSFYNDMN